MLLVEDSATDAELVQQMLSEGRGAMEVGRGVYEVRWVDRLDAARRELAAGRFDVVLLDMRLPDAVGIDALAEIQSAAPDKPVVVLTGFDDDGLALRAIQRGAQDYLAKDHLDGRLLARTIRHAIERKRAQVELLRHAAEVESARVQIERQARELTARAEQLDRINTELDDFAYIASHDLKEPLRGIKAYCEMLREDYGAKLDDTGAKRLGKLVDLCVRLENLVTDLLTYCRLGAVQRANEPVDLNAVFDEVLETLGPTIDRNGGEVLCRRRLPVVHGDPTLIGMAMTNLISNGLKFTESDRPTVEFGCLGGDPPTFFVRDNGIGIDGAHHERIFGLFNKLDNKSEGTGFGLALVKRIIEVHGGTIWVESEGRDKGCTFKFKLPLKKHK